MLAGGEKDWLQGVNFKSLLPPKLQNIFQFCVEFAVKPWIFKDGTRMVQIYILWIFVSSDATNQKGLMKGSDAWSKHELVQAIFIMAFFHSLCGPIYALGILPEVI